MAPSRSAVADPPRPAVRAGAPVRRPRSSVGLKIIMATSGALLVAFLFVHMLGNLKIFVGAEAFDHYAHWLRTIGNPVLPNGWYLWIQRFVLTVAVAAHIWSAAVLAIRARKARPVRYAHRPKIQGSYAARTMRWGGLIVLVFVIWHILDLSTRTVNPVSDSSQAYAAVTADFAPDRWWVTSFYVLAMVMIGFHLRHGVWSALQTLGVSNARRQRALKAVALAVAVVISGGFLIVPLGVTFGLVG